MLFCFFKKKLHCAWFMSYCHVTNCSGLKQCKLVILQFGGLKSPDGSSGLTPRGQQGRVPAGRAPSFAPPSFWGLPASLAPGFTTFQPQRLPSHLFL